MRVPEARFPPKTKFLFERARYKALRGGRGSAKSWSVARALLIVGAAKPLRVLCTREVQKSIQQSVHQLLHDQIDALGFSGIYEVVQHEIRGPNGTRFYFAGLSDLTADQLKSYEGIDVVWIEEGQFTTNRSLNILIPTIRKAGSEIWITFNPELESDPVYQRFVVNLPPDCVSVEMNWRDNPFFPAVLESERAYAEKTMKREEYEHIWEGKCRPAVEGAIYFDCMSTAKIVECPHDPLLKTHLVWDLGWNDATAILLVQKQSSEVRIVHYIEGNQRNLAEYSAELKALRLDDSPINWGRLYLPHDGFAKRQQTGKTDSEVLQGLGWTVEQTPNIDIESGIKRAREIFSRVFFNKARTQRLVECLKRYRRNVSQTTGEPGTPRHDEFSHGADGFRYLACAIDRMSNDEWSGTLKYPKLGHV